MPQILTLVILAALVFAIVKGAINIYNSIVMLNQNVDKAFANIDVLLKQRADEIPNLVKVVKANTTYESELLEKLVSLRTQFLNADNAADKIDLNNQLQSQLGKVIAIAENYPTLKANEAFLQLQKRVSELEDKIADRREFYNESVNLYNVGIKMFPNFIFANLMKYNEKPLLAIPQAEMAYNGVNI